MRNLSTKKHSTQAWVWKGVGLKQQTVCTMTQGTHSQHWPVTQALPLATFLVMGWENCSMNAWWEQSSWHHNNNTHASPGECPGFGALFGNPITVCNNNKTTTCKTAKQHTAAICREQRSYWGNFNINHLRMKFNLCREPFFCLSMSVQMNYFNETA